MEIFHDPQAERQAVDDEVHFRENNVVISTPPTTITSNDLDVIIEGWEQKFEHLSRCMREIQLASEKANTDMHSIARDGRARESIQERRIEEMHEGLTQFLERCDPAHLTASRPFDAPAASTPFTRARRSRHPRRQEYRLDYVQTSTLNLPSIRINLQSPHAT